MMTNGVLLLTMMLAAGSPTAPSLPPCPASPNCVSTQASDAHAIGPLRYRGTATEAMQRLLAILKEMPRATIVASDSTSLRAEFRTAIFRFTDDTVFMIEDGTKTIQFRSASRLGRSDFGVNRRRMEEIRMRFEK